MADTLQRPESTESVAYALMLDLLHADGKSTMMKGHERAATRQEILSAFQEAIRIVKNS